MVLFLSSTLYTHFAPGGGYYLPCPPRPAPLGKLGKLSRIEYSHLIRRHWERERGGGGYAEINQGRLPFFAHVQVTYVDVLLGRVLYISYRHLNGVGRYVFSEVMNVYSCSAYMVPCGRTDSYSSVLVAVKSPFSGEPSSESE